MKRGSGCCAVDIYCTAALTSLSDSVSYITFLFSECRIAMQFSEIIALTLGGKNSLLYTVCWQNLLIEKLQDVALPMQDMLNTKICTCGSNAIIFLIALPLRVK